MRNKFIVASITASCATGHINERCAGQQIVDGSFLDWRRIVVRLIKENGVSNGRLQRPCQWLDEGADRFTTVSMDQSSKFVAVTRRHSL